MTDSGVDLNEIDTAGESRASDARSRPRVVVVSAGVVGVIAIYLALTFSMPTVVPRLNVLPKPAAESSFDGCHYLSDEWQKGTFVWKQVHWSTANSCLAG